MLYLEAIKSIADWLDIPQSANMLSEIQNSICEGMGESVQVDFPEGSNSVRIVCEKYGFDESISFSDLSELHSNISSVDDENRVAELQLLFTEEVNRRFWALVGKLEFLKLENEFGFSPDSYLRN